ncbi:MAG: LCP family protein [Thermomicrobiales bacterium]
MDRHARRWLWLLFAAASLLAVGTTPAFAEPVEPRGGNDGDRVTILLLGGDAGPERSGLRTDSMIVVTIDRATGQAAVFSVPRNLAMTPLPPELAQPFECACWPSLLNELYAYAEANPGLFPADDHPGATALKGAIGHLLGLPIDYFALVDLPGFVDVIDALGGIDVDVPEQVTILLSPAREGEAWQQYDIPPGRQHLDGHQALAYARTREGDSDYDRMARQRCLVGALARGADVSTLLRSYPELLDRLTDSVLTDVPRDELPELIELLDAVDFAEVVVLGFVPPDYTAGWIDPGYPIPDPAWIQQTVASVLDGTSDQGEAFATMPSACSWTE